MKRILIISLVFVLVTGMIKQTFGTGTDTVAGSMNFQEVKLGLERTGAARADYFPAVSQRAVILAPGAMFSKESWHFLAKRFQELGISSLSLNSGSTSDLLNGISYLKARGAKKIAIIGASAGGAGVLYTLRDNPAPLVDKAVLLAPAGGPPLKNANIQKLFIVAEDDMISSSATVYKLYTNSSDPKLFKQFKGSDHAQHLLDSSQKETITQLIISFVQN